MRRNFFKLFLPLALALGMICPSLAEVKEQKEDPIYTKLFKDKKKLTTARGLISLHRYEGKTYIEIPTNLLKREYLLRTVVSRSENVNFIGLPAGPQRYISLEKRDSTIVYKEKIFNIVMSPKDTVQAEAMKLSKGSPIFMRFPIKGYTADSTRIIYDATDLYSVHNTGVIQFKGQAYAPLIMIASMNIDGNLALQGRVESYPQSVMVSNVLSTKLSLSLLGLLPLGSVDTSMECTTYMVLLPETPMTPRLGSDQVGVGVLPYYDYRPRIDTRWRNYVTRRRLVPGQEQIFYIDTLMAPSWQKAITEAAERWNDSFQRIGIGRPLQIKPYPRDKEFNSEDPLRNVISLANSGRSMSVDNTYDPRTAEILASRLVVSRDIAASIRALGMMQLGAVDKRFQTYFIPEDAICDGIRALAIRQFGSALGLVRNLAGSHAYSPQQIRSAEFTQANGFTASVMDDVIFNSITLPGDKEKGVSLIVNRIGSADELALKYLYGDFGTDESEEKLFKFLKQYEGDPRYLYIGDYAVAPSDPRAQSGDLGNDPIVAMKNRIQNIKWLMKEGPKWLTGDNIPSGMSESFPDYIIQEYLTRAIGPLFAYIGGFYITDPNQHSSQPLFTVVDKQLQRRIVKALLEEVGNVDWLNSNPEFVGLAGINAPVTELLSREGQPLGSLLQRLKYLPFTEFKAKETYSSKEFMSDIENYIFSDIHKGRKLSSEKINMLRNYIGTLIGSSRSLKDIETLNRTKARSSFALTDEKSSNELVSLTKSPWIYDLEHRDEFALRRLQAIMYYYTGDRTTDAYHALERVNRLLDKTKIAHPDKLYRSKIEYYQKAIKDVIAPPRQK